MVRSYSSYLGSNEHKMFGPSSIDFLPNGTIISQSWKVYGKDITKNVLAFLKNKNAKTYNDLNINDQMEFNLKFY